jgi:hypothetical protein
MLLTSTLSIKHIETIRDTAIRGVLHNCGSLIGMMAKKLSTLTGIMRFDRVKLIAYNRRTSCSPATVILEPPTAATQVPLWNERMVIEELSV